MIHNATSYTLYILSVYMLSTQPILLAFQNYASAAPWLMEGGLES